MKRLGEILLERGAIAVAELRTGLEACHHSGGRLGTQLLKFNFVEEHALLEALSEQLEVPSVSISVLRRAPEALRRLVPLKVARRLQVMVFDRQAGNLSVAMTTPRNPAVLEEVVSHVGLAITPHVATEVAILTALSEIREEAAPSLPTESDSQRETVQHSETDIVRDADLEEWQNLWSPRALQSKDLLRRRRDRSPEDAPLAATFPDLAPVQIGSVRSAEELEDEIFSSMLGEVEHRDEVGQLLLRRASAVVERCYLLAVHSDQVVGWLAQGAGVVVDDVQSLTFAASTPSVLSTLKGSGVFFGKIEPGPVNDELQGALGEPAPGEMAVLPVVVKNRVVAYLVGDVPGSTIPEQGLEQLVTAVRKAGVALEILIMKKKFLG
jgi:hypothetical protein